MRCATLVFVVCGALTLATCKKASRKPSANDTTPQPAAQDMAPPSERARPADPAPRPRPAIKRPRPVVAVELLPGLKTGMTRKQVRANKTFPVETAAQCAAWCTQNNECCGPAIVAKYHGVRGPDPRVEYLRGKVAGQPARITASFRPKGGLFYLAVLLTAYGDKKTPLLKTPLGVYAQKRFGKPTEVDKSGDQLRWKTAWGGATVQRHQGGRGCRCPRGAKCKCRGQEFVEHRLLIRARR